MTIEHPDAPEKKQAHDLALTLAEALRRLTAREVRVVENFGWRFEVVVLVPFRCELLTFEERAAQDTRARFEGKEER